MALDVPPLKARVNDYDGLLSTGTRNLLEEQLKQLEQEDSTQVVILTITSLKGENLEQYSLKVAETWGIGQKGADNGVLLLIAVNDRKIRIEVGYGLEGVLTDVVAGRIIRNVITPKFRKGQFDAGVINGVAAIVGTVKGEFNTESLKKASDADPALWIIGGMFGFFTIGSIFRKKTIIAGIAGGVYSTLLGLTAPFISGVTSLLIFALVGVIGGVIASSIISSRSHRRSSRTTGFSGGFNTLGGGFGGGFGGFGGGGGGFGGGGASGGW
ncbi:MAG: methanol dehydrogenase [Desulfobulbus propionicus]|nr:MAG: methanol dehydrogenase [Desulfobulbus propionicus]